jgi:hypothetical protein
MKWKSSLTLALIGGAMHLSVFLPTANACECTPAPPPCVAYTDTEIIFLGTVTESNAGLARMRIDRAYKGISEKTVVLWNGGMCDGPNLHVGEQYLMYTRNDGSGYLPSRGCTRSRNARDAKQDLVFLNGLSKAPPTATVFGTITERIGRIYGEGRPALGAIVEIQGEGRNRKGTADREGRYIFSGLAPGSYSVKASLPGFTESESESDDPVEVIARGCGVHDVTLRKNWNGTLRGHVIRADGSPGPVWMNVDLIRVDGEGGKSELLVGFTAKTDEHGEYSFRGLAPGFYKVVLNLYQTPTIEIPYRTVYWPAASTEAAASSIEVKDNPSSRQLDFRLPPPLKTTPVTVLVLLPDGKPARDANANIVTRLDRSYVSAGTAVTDSSGQFSFEAVEGYEYTVMDIRTRDGRMSGEVTFSAADGGRTVTIKLVKREP